MTMPRGPRTFGWRRWHAPVVVLLALLADYCSPAAMWTAILPLAFMAVLLTFRERKAALAVLFLSSWIAIPVSVAAVRVVDSARGAQRVFAVGGVVPGIDGIGGPCDVHAPLTTVLFDGPVTGEAERLSFRVAWTFASLHNSLVDTYQFNRQCFDQFPQWVPARPAVISE
jgi:hypothetical protein